MVKSICVICNKEFSATRKGHFLCSKKCKNIRFRGQSEIKKIDIDDESNYSYNENGCKIPNWNKSKTYTPIRIGKIKYQLHRYVWIAKYGNIEKGLVVCHKCDNPKCCNIEHLFVGTQKENIADMYKKKRNNNVNKEKHGRAILKSEDVLRIRTMLDEKKCINQIAKNFGVSRGCIYNIKIRSSWNTLS